MSIKLIVKGFDELLKQIEKAGGSIDDATVECLKESADIMETALVTQMNKAGVPSHLVSEMPSYTIENDHGLITARVGYRKGAYNPRNPSTGYKIVFLNYGTPHRKKHGKVVGRGFIDKAKRTARPKIRRAQKNTLQKILRGLE